MPSVAQQLVALVKSIEPAAGFFGYYDLVDALEANAAVLAQFKTLLASARPDELDTAAFADDRYGWIVMGAADALDALPADPRNFLPEADAHALAPGKALGALCSACILDDRSTVLRLVTRVDPNKLDHNGQTALSYAVGNNHAECVRILLANGADPNVVQNWGNTPLHVCATTRSSREIFTMLLRAGGNVNVKNQAGRSVADELARHKRSDWVGG
jgi:hypothetical protein